MDLQGQNGLLHTYREGFKTRGLLGILISFGLTGFYLALYFTEAFAAFDRARSDDQVVSLRAWTPW